MEALNKDVARKRICTLVKKYSEGRDAYEGSNYNEETTRAEFIAPLFEALGWDISNEEGQPEEIKDVVHEEGIKIGETVKAPDYTFRYKGARKYFVEAKKPSVNLEHDRAAAFQLRRYGWSSGLPFSILTNFSEFCVYDTYIKPVADDKAVVARLAYYTFEKFPEKFDELWALYSKEAVTTGRSGAYFEAHRNVKRSTEVDSEFLKEIESWRSCFADELSTAAKLSSEELNFAVVATIDRIIFLRIAEGRGIEPTEQLLRICRSKNAYAELVDLYKKADAKYNSGLFDLRADQITTNLSISSGVLKDVLESLYYPKSPYIFSVFSPELLGKVYEQFLGKVITLDERGKASVEDKPEVRKAGGVYYTPLYIVKYITDRTIAERCEGKAPKELSKIRILDPACGSGSFLLAAYEKLMAAHLSWYRQNQPHKHPEAVTLKSGTYKLTTSEKRKILLSSIFGVDVDPQAVEVAKLSLLLKVLEGEDNRSIHQQLKLFNERALPSLDQNIICGNALIAPMQGANLDDARPMEWARVFPGIIKSGGFNIIIGNPPYLNIDNVWGKKDPRLKAIKAQYPLIHTDKTDILFYFISKAIALSTEYVSFIVSRAFLEAYKAKKLRAFIAENSVVEEIVDFQNHIVFEGVGIATCILTLRKKKTGKSRVFKLKVNELPTQELGRLLNQEAVSEQIKLNPENLSAETWSFSPKALSNLNSKIDASGTPLGNILLLGQGMQTGLNKVFGGRVLAELKEWGVSPELYYKRSTNSDIRRYYINTKDENYLLYLEDVEKFADLPLGLQKFLLANAEKLKERAAFVRSNCEWWKYSWPLQKDLYSRRRILCPYLAKVNRFAIDGDDNYLGLTDTTVIFDNKQPECLEYFVGVLNSKLLTYRFRSIGKLKGGGIFEYFDNSVSRLPIRRVDMQNRRDKELYKMIVERTAAITEAQRKLEEARVPQIRAQTLRDVSSLQDEIDLCVYNLYGLSNDEIKEVDEFIPSESFFED